LRVLLGDVTPSTALNAEHLQIGLANLQRDLAIAALGDEGLLLAPLAVAVAFLLGPQMGEHHLVRHFLALKKRRAFFSTRWTNPSYFRSIRLFGLDDDAWRPLMDWKRISGPAGKRRHFAYNKALNQVTALRRSFMEPGATPLVAPWYVSRIGCPSGMEKPLLRRAFQLAKVLRTIPSEEHAPSRVWPAIIANDSATELLIEQLADSLGLAPSAHLSEAIRQITLPRLAASARLDPDRVDAILEDRSLDGQEDLVGCLVLLDAELWLLGHFDDPEESPFHALAERARASKSAVLRLTICVRDVAYRNESRTADLLQMVRSPDPELKTLLNECLWFAVDPNDPTQVAMEKNSRVAGLHFKK
ncbi:MAG: hypothetical protein QOJ33_336, partial [Chloroflexota bacterium]|nr:hypothetical protein [Chloroflexota bacterium]